ncbi:MAG TPA: hypothetical protein VJB87_03790 [Candidatus Nanoarchaeia archaeon]|nr:hypothetical protein [Candidatus Nanoarchaeia archaeon]
MGRHGCLVVGGGLLSILAGVVTCSRMHRQEVRMQVLEKKVAVKPANRSPLLDNLFSTIPQEQKAGLFVDGFYAVVNEGVDRGEQYVRNTLKNNLGGDTYGKK